MIRLRELSFQFPDSAPILNKFDLTLAAGEKACLLGLNGSGKSTLLKLCARLLKPTTGEVQIDAGDDFGFIFQNPDDQIFGTSVREDIAFSLLNQGVARAEVLRKLAKTAEHFGLTELLDRTPEELSAGEKQQLALAGTLIDSPQLLLIDEPTSYLDSGGRATLREMIRSSCATVLAATQFPDEIRDFDRVLFLEGGRLAFDGTPEDFQASEYKPRELSLVHGDRVSPSETRLKAQSVGYHYADGAPVLEAFSHEFRSHSITAIVGSSGSGKTTLSLLLADLLKPSTGEITREAGSIGLLLQFPEHNFFADTVHDEVAFAARNQGEPEEHLPNRVREALAQVGLNYDEFAQRNPFTLSAGEQRRVAIAAVLIMQSTAFIFDEITCGLDWEGRQQMAELLAQLTRDGRCVILCTHDRELVEKLDAEVVEL